MNKKFILPVSLILLVGLAIFVSAWEIEYGTSIHKGWNLIYGFNSPEQIQGLEPSNIKAIYAFIPTTQQYVRVYPTSEEKAEGMEEFGESQFRNLAFWVYSDSETGEDFNGIFNGVEYWLYDEPISYTERQIYKGWNFVGVTNEMIPTPFDANLKDIKGNCNIEKSYFWNADMQKWQEAPIEYAQLEERSLGSGWVIKVSENCKLGTPTEEVPSVPTLP